MLTVTYTRDGGEAPPPSSEGKEMTANEAARRLIWCAGYPSMEDFFMEIERRLEKKQAG